MALLKGYEVHRLFADLLARGDLEQAYQLAVEYMEPQEDGFLRFQHLCLAVRLGNIEPALDWLEHWLSAWFWRRSDALQPLFHRPRFENCLQALEKKERNYWVEGRMKPPRRRHAAS